MRLHIRYLTPAKQIFDIGFILDISHSSEDTFNTNWKLIQKFLNSIYSFSIPEDFCYLELFRVFSDSLLNPKYNNFFFQVVEDICIDKYDEKLYEQLKIYYKQIFERDLLAILKKDHIEILKELESLWLKIRTNQQIVSEILTWFEKSCLVKTRVKTVEKLILLELHGQFEKMMDVRDTVIQQLIKQIMLERSGQQINRNQIKSVVEIFIKIEYYKPYFEPEFLRLTQNHYQSEAKCLIEKFDVCAYLNNTQLRINQEKERVQSYLENSTETKVVTMLERLFIDGYLQKILAEGFEYLVDNQNLTNLQQLYNFLNKLGRIEFLKNTWQFYIKRKGINLVNTGEIGVEPILEFKQKLDEVLNNCFESNYVLKNSLHYAFEDFVNIKTNKIAELTSKYFDNILQKAHKMNLSEDSLEKLLDDALCVFKYLSAKDIFEAFYNKRLMKRLLLRNISSFELEKKMIEKFKAECGTQFTKKFEDVFNEFELSKSFIQEYTQTELYGSIKQDIGSLDFHINVFSTNCWPLKNQTVARFPSPLDKIITSYTQFYVAKFAGVVLFWQYDTSTCEVQGFFPKNKQSYTFQVSLVQAIILTAFNTKGSIKTKEIEQILGIDSEEAKLNLLGLYSPQAFKDKTDPILLKTPSEMKSGPEDTFKINDNFSSKHKRIKVNQAQKKEAKEDIESTTNRVLQERQYLLDASIVKIMKSKRTLLYNELVNEVFNTLKLPISLVEIKKRIENLTERDYVERDKDNIQMYHYVA